MFKTDTFFGNKKLSLIQNVWHDHATMQQVVLLGDFYIEIRLRYTLGFLKENHFNLPWYKGLVFETLFMYQTCAFGTLY